MIRYVCSALFLFAGCVSASQAQAVLIPALGWGYSIGYGIAKGTGIAPPGYTGLTTWSIYWDPPATLLKGQATFDYDPSLITIHPEYSGFLGQFSDNPSIDMPVNSSEVYPAMDVTNMPGPRPGTTANLTVGPNTVTLNYDFTANPLTVDAGTGHLNMFELMVTTSQPIAGFTLESEATGAFTEVGSPTDQSQTYATCSDSNGLQYACGGTPDRGLAIVATPEPSAVSVFVIGTAGLLGCARRRRKKAA